MKLFGIERALSEIIEFLLKFWRTFQFPILRPRIFFSKIKQYETDDIITYKVFFLLAVSIYVLNYEAILSQDTWNPNQMWVSFLSGLTIQNIFEKLIFTIIPIIVSSLILNSFIKILGSKSNDTLAIKIFFIYWLSMSLLIYSVFYMVIRPIYYIILSEYFFDSYSLNKSFFSTLLVYIFRGLETFVLITPIIVLAIEYKEKRLLQIKSMVLFCLLLLFIPWITFRILKVEYKYLTISNNNKFEISR